MGELGEGWLITRYDDAVHILKDARVKKLRNAFTEEELENFSALEMKNLYQSICSTQIPRPRPFAVSCSESIYSPDGFTARKQNPKIADSLLDQVEPNHSMNLVDDFAFPLPIIVISEMLGIPLEDRQNSEFGPRRLLIF
ncbi:hypothetical protein PO124_32025 [Bacillus licheniformis]|nr:hypothetical protein [Bacillus licheniformis]